MYVSPFETSVTRGHRTTGKRIEPSLVNGRAKPGAPKASKDDK